MILSSAAQAALPRQLAKAVALTYVDRAAPAKESRPDITGVVFAPRNTQGRSLEEIQGTESTRRAAARV